MYGTQSAADLLADLSFEVENENGNEIYKCFYDPAKAIKNNVPYEDQEIWQIVLIRQWKQADGTIVMKVLYPNGSTAHDFAPNKIDTYNFRYRL